MSGSSNETPGSSQEEDQAPRDAPFDPSIEDLIHDYDDERTLDEEEAMAANEGEATNQEAELSSLEKELQMPIEELLVLYGRKPDAEMEQEDDSETAENKKSKLNVLYERNIDDSNLVCITVSDDEEEDCDSDSADVFITTLVGPKYQVEVPDFVPNDADNPEDQLLWKPSQEISDEAIEGYLKKVYDIIKMEEQAGRGDIEAAALHLLYKLGYNIEEALKKLEQEGPTVLEDMNANKKEWPENEMELQVPSRGFLQMKKSNN